MITTIADVRAALDKDPTLGPYITTIKISNRRKSLGISMRPGDAGLTLNVPSSSTPAAVVAALAAKRHRLSSMLIKAKELAPDTPVKELVNGSGFLWLGKNNRLRLIDNAAEAVRHVNDQGDTTTRDTWAGRWLELDRTTLHLGAKPLINWYIHEGNAWLDRHAERLWTQITGGLRPLPSISAARIGAKRWGVCRQEPDPSDNRIRIAWQTFQLRPALVRHVLTHELVHASRPGGRPHGPEFWRAFERAAPGARQRQRELDQEGKAVWLGEIFPPVQR